MTMYPETQNRGIFPPATQNQEGPIRQTKTEAVNPSIKISENSVNEFQAKLLQIMPWLVLAGVPIIAILKVI